MIQGEEKIFERILTINPNVWTIEEAGVWKCDTDWCGHKIEIIAEHSTLSASVWVDHVHIYSDQRVGKLIHEIRTESYKKEQEKKKQFIETVAKDFGVW